MWEPQTPTDRPLPRRPRSRQARPALSVNRPTNVDNNNYYCAIVKRSGGEDNTTQNDNLHFLLSTTATATRKRLRFFLIIWTFSRYTVYRLFRLLGTAIYVFVFNIRCRNMPTTLVLYVNRSHCLVFHESVPHKLREWEGELLGEKSGNGYGARGMT